MPDFSSGDDIIVCLAYARDILSSERGFRPRPEMRFLDNENFPGAAVKLLQSAGYDIAWVRTAALVTRDPDALAWAARESHILLTVERTSASWQGAPRSPRRDRAAAGCEPTYGVEGRPGCRSAATASTHGSPAQCRSAPPNKPRTHLYSVRPIGTRLMYRRAIIPQQSCAVSAARRRPPYQRCSSGCRVSC